MDAQVEAILQGIQSLDGVLSTAAIGSSGQLVAVQMSGVYDLGMMENLGASVATALDSLQLAQEDWDSVTANFADGKLLIRNLMVNGTPSASGLRALAVVADGRVNLSFAGVAIRVAVSKLKAVTPGSAADAVAAPSPLNSLSQASSSALGSNGSSFNVAKSVASTPEVASPGLSWSGVSGSSSIAASGVSVTDAASAAFLTSCTKALARNVGPMAKVFVKDAIRKLWPARPFSLDLAPLLLAELETHIEDPTDRAQFSKTVKTA